MGTTSEKEITHSGQVKLQKQMSLLEIYPLKETCKYVKKLIQPDEIKW